MVPSRGGTKRFRGAMLPWRLLLDEAHIEIGECRECPRRVWAYDREECPSAVGNNTAVRCRMCTLDFDVSHRNIRVIVNCKGGLRERVRRFVVPSEVSDLGLCQRLRSRDCPR